MKKRLASLDGLRGLAALSVLFSHSGFSLDSVIHIPLLTLLYKTFAVGPNSVQILFVLSGFLMAYLYPRIIHPISFIKKRYARIIPVYILVVVFISEIYSKNIYWQSEIFQLILLAIIPALIWYLIEKVKLASLFGTILFYSYVIVQVLFLFLNIFITPRFIQYGTIHLPEFYKHILILMSNITLTTPFVEGVPRISGVFWSLAPEIYFYLLYPIIVIPLIFIGKKWGKVVSFLIAISILKILFDLSTAFMGIGSLYSIDVARASGFVAGVLAGSIYQAQGSIWNKISKWGLNPFFGTISILSFVVIQWGDWAIRDGQSIHFMNLYYLVSSFVIAILALVSSVPTSLPNKIFSSKMLVFFGALSYSMYLIHIQTNHWVGLLSFLPFYSILYPILVLCGATLISRILFICIESIYFRSKSKNKEVSDNLTKAPLKINALHYALILIVAFGCMYSGGYSLSFLLQRHTTSMPIMGLQFERSLLNSKLRVPIIAHYDNLSAIHINLRYAKSANETRNKVKNPSVLFFRLLDEDKKKVIFESKRSAFEIEGSPRFPFGITTISDSKNKRYSIELELVNGKIDDQIYVDMSQSSIVSIYTTSKKALLMRPHIFLMNRLIYILTNRGMIFAMFVIGISYYLYEKRK